MGGSGSSRIRLFLDLARTRQERMEKAYSADPTPALREKTESGRKLLSKLEREHERFSRMMEMGDAELSARASNARGERFIGESGICRKLAERRMGKEEYTDLTEGPTLIMKIGKKEK